MPAGELSSDCKKHEDRGCGYGSHANHARRTRGAQPSKEHIGQTEDNELSIWIRERCNEAGAENGHAQLLSKSVDERRRDRVDEEGGEGRRDEIATEDKAEGHGGQEGFHRERERANEAGCQPVGYGGQRHAGGQPVGCACRDDGCKAEWEPGREVASHCWFVAERWQ